MALPLTRVPIHCPQGEISGVQALGYQYFLRIPFARAERFALPQPLGAWSGVLDASQKPEQPFQVVAPFVSGSTTESEDCLFVNVYTPNADNKKRAVMVWFYGGGFTQGSAYNALYNGKHLAAKCDVVVVTVNYRVGLLGYGYFDHFAHPEFSPKPNLGLYDQIEALRWVKNSIAAFGGDPDMVTVFGQSAGAMSISAMLASPQAKGLFKRAICQSGGDALISSRETVARVTDNALRKIKIPSDNISLLKSIHAKDTVKGPDGLLHLTYGTELLPEKPLDVLLRGDGHKVDLMMGYTRHEVATPLLKHKLRFLLPIIKLFTTVKIQATYDDIHQMPLLSPKLNNEMQQAIDFYKSYYASVNKKGSEAGICTAILTDAIFAQPARNFLKAHSQHNENTYAFRFNWGVSILGTPPVSFHACDVPFPFGTLDALSKPFKWLTGVKKETEILSENMMYAWAAFAKTGNPNHSNLPQWKNFSTQAQGFMIFDNESQFVQDEREELFRFWDKFLGEYQSALLE